MQNLLAGLASQLTRNWIKSYEMHKPYSLMCSRSSNLSRPHMLLNRSSSRRLLPNLSNARRVLMSALSCTNLKRPFPGRYRSRKQAFFRCLCTSALHARLVLHPFVLQLRDLRSRDRAWSRDAHISWDIRRQREETIGWEELPATLCVSVDENARA